MRLSASAKPFSENARFLQGLIGRQARAGMQRSDNVQGYRSFRALGEQACLTILRADFPVGVVGFAHGRLQPLMQPREAPGHQYCPLRAGRATLTHRTKAVGRLHPAYDPRPTTTGLTAAVTHDAGTANPGCAVAHVTGGAVHGSQ